MAGMQYSRGQTLLGAKQAASRLQINQSSGITRVNYWLGRMFTFSFPVAFAAPGWRSVDPVVGDWSIVTMIFQVFGVPSRIVLE